ncbi:MAG: prolipoprotein diacylglyceryl transferase [Anaerolineae bacterium]|nr:prolipoprotein diacylglyceryl transferase [Anaerolineae bacterium]
MLPTLLIGEIALPTYPLSLLIAFWAGLTLAAYLAQGLNLESDHVYNAGLYGFVAGILGARLWFVLSHWENYASDLGQALSLSRSALSVPEGFIIAALVVVIYLQRNKVPIATFMDAVGPGIALALVIGNLGAFLGGVKLGAPATVPWAIELVNTPRHPVQLYEAGATLIVLGLLILWRQQRPWPGFQFWLFVLLYSTVRLGLEIFIARPAVVGNGFLAVQLYALSAIVLSLAVMAYNFKTDSDSTEVHPHEVI